MRKPALLLIGILVFLVNLMSQTTYRHFEVATHNANRIVSDKRGISYVMAQEHLVVLVPGLLPKYIPYQHITGNAQSRYFDPSFLVCTKDAVWVGDKQGLGIVDNFLFSPRLFPIENAQSRYFDPSFLVCTKDAVWVGDKQGLGIVDNFLFSPRLFPIEKSDTIKAIGSNKFSRNPLDMFPIEKSDTIKAIIPAGKDTGDVLVLFSSGEVSKFNRKKNKRQPLYNGVKNLFLAESGNRFFINNKGIHWLDTLDNAHPIHLNHQPALDSITLLSQDEDFLFLVARDSLWSYKKDAVIPFDYCFETSRSKPHAAKKFSALAQIFDGKDRFLMAGTYEGGLYRLRISSSGAHQKMEAVKTLLTADGRYRIETITTLHRTHDGALWIGTRGGSALLWSPFKERLIISHLPPDSAQRLQSRQVWSITTPDDGESVWAGLETGRIFGVDSAGRKHPIVLRNMPVAPVRSLHAGKKTAEGQILWVGLEKAGLTAYTISGAGSDRKFVALKDLPNLAVRTIFAISQRGDTLFLATDQGLKRLVQEGSKWRKLPSVLTKYAVNHFLLEPNRILLATNKGLLAVSLSGEELPLPHLSDELQKKHIKHIFPEKNQGYWVSTLDDFLYFLDTSLTKIEHFNENNGLLLPNGLKANLIYGCLTDQSGNLWALTNFGLFRKGKDAGYFDRFDREDLGLPTDEGDTGALLAAAGGKKLFFGFRQGLVEVRADTFGYFYDSLKPALSFVEVITGDSMRCLDFAETISRDQHFDQITLHPVWNDFHFPFARASPIYWNDTNTVLAAGGSLIIRPQVFNKVFNLRKEIKPLSFPAWNQKPSTVSISYVNQRNLSIAVVIFIVFILFAILAIIFVYWFRNRNKKAEVDLANQKQLQQAEQLFSDFLVNLSKVDSTEKDDLRKRLDTFLLQQQHEGAFRRLLQSDVLCVLERNREDDQVFDVFYDIDLNEGRTPPRNIERVDVREENRRPTAWVLSLTNPPGPPWPVEFKNNVLICRNIQEYYDELKITDRVRPLYGDRHPAYQVFYPIRITPSNANQSDGEQNIGVVTLQRYDGVPPNEELVLTHLRLLAEILGLWFRAIYEEREAILVREEKERMNAVLMLSAKALDRHFLKNNVDELISYKFLDSELKSMNHLDQFLELLEANEVERTELIKHIENIYIRNDSARQRLPLFLREYIEGRPFPQPTHNGFIEHYATLLEGFIEEKKEVERSASNIKGFYSNLMDASTCISIGDDAEFIKRICRLYAKNPAYDLAFQENDVVVEPDSRDFSRAEIPRMLVQPLVENACRYGSRPVRVKIVYRLKEGPDGKNRVRIDVHNTGTLPAIQTENDGRKTPSSTEIIRKIVELNGGTVYGPGYQTSDAFENIPGVVFSIQLPLLDPKTC